MYNAQTFNIPELKGLSEKSIKEHLKLYEGYVENANAILKEVSKLAKNPTEHVYAITEMMRRFSFEYNGMRNHEYYFAQFEGGSQDLADNSLLKKEIENMWGSFDVWLEQFKVLAKTRGVGWAMLAYDPKTEKLVQYWVDEQHLGQLNGVQPVLTLDMWEHSFVADYQPSGKGQYIDDSFANLNWSVCEKWLEEASQ